MLAKVLTNTQTQKTDNILRENAALGLILPSKMCVLEGILYRNYTAAMQLVTPRAVAMAVRIEMAH